MHSLSKETTQALQVLSQSLMKWDGKLLPNIELDETCIETDYKAFSGQRIFLLKGNEWRWNRTSHFTNIEIEPGVMVTISKMNSRSKVARRDSPTYKVWLYTVTREGANPLYFVWCERGHPPILVEHYSFLRPFVSDAIAKELHWI